jgi:hypothetical protein
MKTAKQPSADLEHIAELITDTSSAMLTTAGSDGLSTAA